MNSKQINQYDMYLRVQLTLNSYKPVWGSNTRIMANYETFIRNLQVLEELNAKADVDSTAISKQKNAWKEQLVEDTVSLVRKVMSFAADTDNKALATQIDYSKSDLRNLRESQLPGVCHLVCQQAGEHLDQLGEYGVTSAELDQLRSLADQFKVIIPEPKSAISTSKHVTEALADVFRKNNALLSEQLDGKLEQFKKTNAIFYNAYFDARNIIDRTTRKPEDEAEKDEKAV